jgi:hypothetical protein
VGEGGANGRNQSLAVRSSAVVAVSPFHPGSTAIGHYSSKGYGWGVLAVVRTIPRRGNDHASNPDVFCL